MKRKLLYWSFLILLLLGIYGYFRITEYLQYKDMKEIWQMKDGQIIQIKKDGQYIKQEGN